MKAGSRAECDALTRYLIGLAADDYVADQYRRGVEQLQIRESRFDRLLCSWARRSRPTARAADFYGRLFRPAGALRRKLVLLLAILESYGPTAAVTDRAPWSTWVLGVLCADDLPRSGVGAGPRDWVAAAAAAATRSWRRRPLVAVVTVIGSGPSGVHLARKALEPRPPGPHARCRFRRWRDRAPRPQLGGAETTAGRPNRVLSG